LRAAQRLEEKFAAFRPAREGGLEQGDRVEPTGETIRFTSSRSLPRR
jgi:hypothetical protein